MLFLNYRLITLISLFFITACSSSVTQIQLHELGEVIDLHTGQRLSPMQFAKQIATHDYLLIGEQHDELKHHQAQFWLLKQLQQTRAQGSIALEMLSIDQQADIAKISQNPSAYMHNLPSILRWKQSWNWAYYADLIQSAFANQTEVLATNLTQEEVQTLMRGAEPLNGYRSTTTNVQQKIADLITAQHGFETTSGKNSEIIRKMVQVQQFRDRRMAEKLAQAKTPSLLIAGNHHVNRQIGVPLHLADLAPNIKITSILLGATSENISAKDADYYWILK